MPKFDVEITRSISVMVPVEAVDAAAAMEQVGLVSFELPARTEWTGHKDWRYEVFKDGQPVLDND